MLVESLSRTISLVKRTFILSEPRMWLYNGGLFFFGSSVGYHTIKHLGNNESTSIFTNNSVLEYFLYLFWFAAMTNVYAITLNNYYDRYDDIKNPKKINYGAVAKDEDRSTIFIGTIISAISFLTIYYFFRDENILYLVIIFFLANYLYSAPPVRAKQYFFLDTLIGPAYYLSIILSAFVITSRLMPSAISLLGALAYWLAVEIYYNKVIDIEVDKYSVPNSTVVKLGREKSIIISIILMLVAGSIFFYIKNFYALVVVPHIMIFVLSLFAKNSENILRIYSKTYLINIILGVVVTSYFFSF